MTGRTTRVTAAHEAAVLALLQASGPQRRCDIARGTGLSAYLVGQTLSALQARGAAYQNQWRAYEAGLAFYDPADVDEALCPRLFAFLDGRRELPGRVARELHLPERAVRATLAAMAERGELHAVPVGRAVVYALAPKHVVTVDPASRDAVLARLAAPAFPGSIAAPRPRGARKANP